MNSNFTVLKKTAQRSMSILPEWIKGFWGKLKPHKQHIPPSVIYQDYPKITYRNKNKRVQSWGSAQ